MAVEASREQEGRTHDRLPRRSRCFVAHGWLWFVAIGRTDQPCSDVEGGTSPLSKGMSAAAIASARSVSAALAVLNQAGALKLSLTYSRTDGRGGFAGASVVLDRALLAIF